MAGNDALIPFVFDALPVRGAIVQLKSAWQRMQLGHDYPAPARRVLGHAAAATALIAQNLKFKGNVTLQLSGDGPLGVLVMQATEQLDIRGTVTVRGVDDDTPYAEMVEGARCAVTVGAGAMERPYQGIVEVSTLSLAASLETYFTRSVQVPSHLALLSEPSLSGGILLQQMPGELPVPADDWRRLGLLAATLRSDDVRTGLEPELLHRLFAEDDLRVFAPRLLRFRCRCSRSRVEDVLRLLGEAETRSTLREQGRIDVTCEYCGKVRHFDAIDVSRVFADGAVNGSSALH